MVLPPSISQRLLTRIKYPPGLSAQNRFFSNDTRQNVMGNQQVSAPRRRVRAVVAGLWVALWASGGGAWAAGPVPSVADDVATGAKLAAQHCASCHGTTGQGTTPDFPNLAGQNEKYLAKQLRDFASGRRESTVMEMKAAVLSECSIRAVSRYYQSQAPQVQPAKDPMLASAGAFVYERGNPYTGLPGCVSCHGTGARGHAELPRLAGQNPLYLERQLKKFVDRSREDESAVMNVMAARMSEIEMKSVVEYLGAMQ
jgi:cytochrome c553